MYRDPYRRHAAPCGDELELPGTANRHHSVSVMLVAMVGALDVFTTVLWLIHS